jgi:TetR/AcrR family transcriptional repressor of nem operon
MPRTGRPRSFDEEAMVGRARDVFWAHGYEATSVQDLVDHLGIERGSLYGAFGDKRSLYLRAVSLYASDNRARLQAALAADPVLPTLYRMLREPSTLTGASASKPRRGCLVGNTTAELVPGDDGARALVADAYEGFVEVVSEALRRGQARGEVAGTASPEAQAHLLLLVFQGSALVSRAGGDPDRLSASLDALFDSLRAKPPARAAKAASRPAVRRPR